MNSAEQLLQKIKNMFPNFTCNLQDLRNPTEEFVTNFYINWLQEFEVDGTNIHHLQLQQSNVVGLYPDAFSSFTFKANLLKAMRQFEIIPDFGMMDIHSPTPNRIQHILRALMDFFNVADESVCSLMEKKNILRERKEKITTLIRNKEERKKHTNDLVTYFATIQKEEKELEDHIQQLTLRAPSLKKQKQLAKTVVDEANERLKEKEKTLQKLNKELATVTNKMKESVSLIVDSPSSFLGDVDCQREKEKELADSADQKRVMVEEKMQKELKLQTYLSLLQEKIQVLNEVFQTFQLLKKESKVLSKVEKKMKANEERLNELISALTALVEKIEAQQETLQESRLQSKTLETQLTEDVDHSLKQFNQKKDAKKNMISDMKELSKFEDMEREYTEKMKKFNEQFDKDCHFIENKKIEYFTEVGKRLTADIEDFEAVKRAENKKSHRK